MATNDIYVGTESYRNDVKNGKISKPTTIDPNQKGDGYYLAWARYVWAQYVTGRTLIPYGGFSVAGSGRSFYDLRAYGIGRQDKRIYMDMIDPCDDPNKNEGYVNINWDIVQVMSKFRDLIRGKMITMDFDVVTTAIDETSIKERDEKVNMMKLLARPEMQAVIQATGIVPSTVKLPPGIETPEDVEVFNKMGGFRLAHELMIQDAIESTNYESNWDSIKNQIAEDIIDLNVAATVCYLEKATGIVKVDRIEPEFLICRPSKYQDHRDIDFAGHIKKKTIQSLRIESNLSEEQLLEIARVYKGHGTNGIQLSSMVGLGDLNYQRTIGTTNPYYYNAGIARPYDNFTVDVMEFYFVAKEVEKYLLGYHGDGNMIYDKVDLEAELNNKDKKKGKGFEEREIEYVYGCKWIVGTNYVFDCGKEYAVVRQGHNGVKRAKLPITIYSDRSPSIVERCIPFVDDIQLAVLKKRNVLAKMAPGPRIAMDKSLMEDSVMIGNANYNMLQLLELFPKTGILVYESVGEWETSEMGGSNRPPITFLPSGIQEDIGILLQDVEVNMRLIRDVTGVNEIADGSSQQQDMLVKVMEGLTAATNNALRPHFQLYYGLYQLQCRYVAQKWQVSVLNGDIKTGYVPIGDNILKPVLLTQDLYDYDFGIKIILRPTEQDRQMLLQKLMMASQGGQISEADYFVLYNMINSGDLKKAQFYYAKATAMWQRKLQEMKIQEMQAQSQAQAQAAMAIEQAKLQTMQMEAQLEAQKLQLQHQLEKEMAAINHKYKLEELMLVKSAEIEQVATQKTMEYALENNQGGNFA